MATQTPIVVQKENLRTHKGKGAKDIKADVPKPVTVGRQDRKALRDLSNVGKTVLSGAAKGPALKQKSVLHPPESKTESKSYPLTDEQLKKCQEWAKEGIEHTHFTGTDQHKLQQEKNEERIKKKVEKVMTAFHEWLDMSYKFPVSVAGIRWALEIASDMNMWDQEEFLDESDSDSDDLREMELMPEELPPPRTTEVTKFDEGEFEDFDWDLPFSDHPLELKLKDESDNNI